MPAATSLPIHPVVDQLVDLGGRVRVALPVPRRLELHSAPRDTPEHTHLNLTRALSEATTAIASNAGGLGCVLIRLAFLVHV